MTAAIRCPLCQCEGAILEDLSRIAHVNYYRCVDGHIWTIAKDGSNAQRPTLVTELTRASES